MTIAFDNRLRDLSAELDHVRAERAELDCRERVLMGRIEAMQEARELLAGFVPASVFDAPPPLPEPAAERRRHDIEGPVMRYLSAYTADEETIVKITDLPPDSVHQFLLRAVRLGKVVRAPNNEYRLPATTNPVVSATAKPSETVSQSTSLSTSGGVPIPSPDRETEDSDPHQSSDPAAIEDAILDALNNGPYRRAAEPPSIKEAAE